MLKSIIIFFIGASLSLYLHITYGQDTSLSTNGLFGILAYIFITIPMTITGFVLFIRSIDKIVADKKVENNFLSKSYLYLKVAVGFLFFFLGFSLIYLIVTDPPYDKSSWIWIILFIGFFFRMGSIFILGAYRKLKEINA
ncbi:hypothetical protein C9926_00495 [Sulfurovum lithotrophicum]|nr:hypothetical protein C9926_00495 [Sulfurovum lithotrophicum]